MSSNKRPNFGQKLGALNRRGRLLSFFSTNSNFILAKSSCEKKPLQHYPSKRKFSINIFRLLKQRPIIEHIIVPVQSKLNRLEIK